MLTDLIAYIAATAGRRQRIAPGGRERRPSLSDLLKKLDQGASLGSAPFPEDRSRGAAARPNTRRHEMAPGFCAAN